MLCHVSLTRDERDRLGMAIEAAAIELSNAKRADPKSADRYERVINLLDQAKMPLFEEPKETAPQ